MKVQSRMLFPVCCRVRRYWSSPTECVPSAGADHIVVLEKGRVVQQGTPEELMEQEVFTGEMDRTPKKKRRSGNWEYHNNFHA